MPSGRIWKVFATNTNAGRVIAKTRRVRVDKVSRKRRVLDMDLSLAAH